MNDPNFFHTCFRECLRSPSPRPTMVRPPSISRTFRLIFKFFEMSFKFVLILLSLCFVGFVRFQLHKSRSGALALAESRCGLGVKGVPRYLCGGFTHLWTLRQQLGLGGCLRRS